MAPKRDSSSALLVDGRATELEKRQDNLEQLFIVKKVGHRLCKKVVCLAEAGQNSYSAYDR